VRRAVPVLLLLAAISSGQAVRFQSYDVYVDAADDAVAAWQIEVVAGDGATIVGVEGGEPECWRAPAYYDPAALKGGRIILAAFTTEPGPPRGRVRVARLNFMLSGEVALEAEVIAAAAPGGTRIPIRVELTPKGDGK